MRSVERDMAQKLEEGGFGTFAQDIFVAREPESPDNTITVLETPGRGFSQFMVLKGFTQNMMFNRAFDVYIRSNNYDVGYQHVINIPRYLLGLDPFEITDAHDTAEYSVINEDGDVFSMGMDDNSRYRWVIPFVTIKKRKD